MRVPMSTLLLVALNVMLLAGVGRRLFQEPGIDLAANESRTVDIYEVPRLAPMAPVFDGLQVQAVFHESRSFYTPPVAPLVEQQPPDYRLVGSISIPNQPASAVLMSNQFNTRTRVVTGDQLEGWTVVEVGPSRVVVQLGERTAQFTSAARPQGGGVTRVPAVPPPKRLVPSGTVRVIGTPLGTQLPAAPQLQNEDGSAPR